MLRLVLPPICLPYLLPLQSLPLRRQAPPMQLQPTGDIWALTSHCPPSSISHHIHPANKTLSKTKHSMKIISWNVKGLHSLHKRMAILHHLKRLKADVALLQESHLTEADFPRMCKLWVGQVYGSAAAKGKAGVVILIHKNLPCEVLSSVHDTEGRILTLTLKLFSRKWALTNVYALTLHPNSSSNN